MQKHNLTLQPTLRIESCSAFKEVLNSLLQDNLELTISANELESVDAAGAQLLAAFELEVERRNGTVIWLNPSQALQHAAYTLGFPQLGKA